MLEAVLFDLDDTLLGNAMDTFLPAYFQALTGHLDDLLGPDQLIAHLMEATQAMDADHSPERTNEEAFASVFYPLVGLERSEVESAFEHFYGEAFPNLRSLTRRRPEARSLVASALEQGLQVVIATNPMFPRMAVEERLAWAGVPVEQFGYALVTTYENMHATKSHQAYYKEILEHLGRRPGECLMVGDSWEMDIVPAASTGIAAYWVTDEDALPSSSPPVVESATVNSRRSRDPRDAAQEQASGQSSSQGGLLGGLLVGWGTLADLWAEVQSHGWAW
jgi:FMN phosphatase YigB (HAD superfamily)